jgi:3-hydroxymyristoyl/3-hydroxydecanoyl-(acyl carrier protein) dehydratase
MVFKAHFFEDPVQPGSLGLQAMCQLLQWYVVERGLAAGPHPPRFAPVRIGHPVTWKYRGQVVPTDRRLTVELEVTEVGEDTLGPYATADGWLWVDGRRIYHVTNLGARVLALRP